MEMESLKNAASLPTRSYHAVEALSPPAASSSNLNSIPSSSQNVHFEVESDDENDNDDHESKLYHRRYHPQQQQQQQLCDLSNSSSSDSDNEEDLWVDRSSSSNWLSQSQAIILLVKGNLGPGCLNLPNAFASIGWKWATLLFAFIAFQGIYSMWLLVDCKKTLLLSIQQSQTQSSPTERQRNSIMTTQLTFMDVAERALGKMGSRLVEFFLVILQGGVCCVFLSLIATNLVAWIHISQGMALLSVTIVLHGVVLLRFLSDLTWLSATANAFMILAILTATIAGMMSAFQQNENHQQDPSFFHSISLPKEQEISILFQQHHRHTTTVTSATTTAMDFVANVAMFVSDMFFAFEGIGLVLPIENSYTITSSLPRTNPSRHQHHRSSPSFSMVLIRSMMITVGLFLLIGIPASIGFPDITSGSVTAYLEQRYPRNIWFSFVNILVMMAVLFTFPLQLTPAIEVLDRWFDRSPNESNDAQSTYCCKRGCWSWLYSCCSSWNYDIQRIETEDTVPSSENVVPTQPMAEDSPLGDNIINTPHNDVLSIESASEDNDEIDNSWSLKFVCRLQKQRWIIRRWLVVLTCACMVYLVGNNLGLLIALFGAVGQTGLAGMPCAIHLALQRQGIASKTSLFRTVMDYGILAFCGLVMIMGVTFAIKNIVANGS